MQPDAAHSLRSSAHKILVQNSDTPQDGVPQPPLQPLPQTDRMEQQIQQQQQQWQQQQHQWQQQQQQWQQQQHQWLQQQQQRQQEWRQQQILP
ncbi:MAG TPA: hypothetical protein V6D19_04895 [Stenomitos sp.]